MRRILVLLALLLAGAPTAAGAGGGGGGGVCRAFAEGTTLTMRDNCFEGTAHRIEPGVLRVVNDGALPHTVTAADGSFDSGPLAPGESYQLTLRDPGAIPIYCTLHGTADGAGMAGAVLVAEAGGALRVAAIGAEPQGAPAPQGGQHLATPLSGAAVLLAGLALAVAWRARRRTVERSGL